MAIKIIGNTGRTVRTVCTALAIEREYGTDARIMAVEEIESPE